MCMPVMPRSRSPVHMAEAATWRSVHDMRIALYLMERADKEQILDKAKPVSVADVESYLADATKSLLMVVKAYCELREAVGRWRLEDNKEGSNEYVI